MLDKMTASISLGRLVRDIGACPAVSLHALGFAGLRFARRVLFAVERDREGMAGVKRRRGRSLLNGCATGIQK